MSSVKLYSFSISSASWRVRIALALKGIKYESAVIDLKSAKHKTNDFSSLNPMQQVPALSVDGFTMSQSMAIIEYLDEKFPEGVRLFPVDLKRKFKVRQLCEIVNSGIQPLQNGSKYLEEDKRTEFVRGFITRGFTAFEKILQETSGIYCMGDEVTAADVFLVPQISGAKRFGVDLSPFPLITRIGKKCDAHKAFIEASPDNNPDK